MCAAAQIIFNSRIILVVESGKLGDCGRSVTVREGTEMGIQSMVLTNIIIAAFAFASSLGLWACSKASKNGTSL
jgi:hypothetical protein